MEHGWEIRKILPNRYTPPPFKLGPNLTKGGGISIRHYTDLIWFQSRCFVNMTNTSINLYIVDVNLYLHPRSLTVTV